ncbi:hypothetical protein [Methylobacterium sp. CM6246]
MGMNDPLIGAAMLSLVILCAQADQVLGSDRIEGANELVLPGGPTLRLWEVGTIKSRLATASLTVSAPRSIKWAGATPLATEVLDLNASSNSTQEAGAIFRMTSSKGASTGTGPLSAFKIPLATEMVMQPGSGNGYGFNSVITAQKNVDRQQVLGVEINVNTNNLDYTPVIGSPFANFLTLGGISAFPSTSGIFINDVGSSSYMVHEGIWFYGRKTVKDHTIRDDTSSAVSYSIGGEHGSASISDNAITPTALNLGGTYSLSAIFTANSSATVAFAAGDGQRVCFKGVDVCLYHSDTSLRLSIGGSDVAQISDSGGGTFTTLSATGLTKLGVFNYDHLPPCVSANQYTYVTVVDALTVAFGQAINKGGGSNQVLVYCNGNAWVQR